MRLLTWDSHDQFILIEVFDPQIPPYAILSHTWGAPNDEVNFSDLQQGRGGDKSGYEKLRFCGEQAKKDKIKYFWIDTCCINKDSSAELAEAINSMYRWYQNAEKCYVYLSDVFAIPHGSDGSISPTWESSLRESRWFKRGWTLQELLAPKVVEFFSRDKVFLGTKRRLAEQICQITTLPLDALYGTPVSQFSVPERWRWTHGRETSRKEDMAYCLFGIFDVFLPLIYSEGERAFHRLRKAIDERAGAGASICMPINNEPMISPHASSSRLALTQHVCFDGNHEERAPKRRRMDQTETGSMQIHEQPISDGRSSDEKDFDTLLKSLPFTRIDFRVNNVKKALLSTCQWLFQHPDFQAWYHSSGSEEQTSFLWIKGKPGCGKSTLMKAALEWTRKHTGKKRGRDTIVPYFFNARASASLEKSSLGLYRTVVYHLLSSQSSLRALFAENFVFKDPGQSGENWTTEELQEFLYDAVDSKKPFTLCLLIDALDEAEHEDDVRQMISFFVQLSDRVLAAGGPCQLQICLSSRHYPHISVGRGLSFVVEEQPEHRKDIETYITKRLTCPESPGMDELRSEILNKSARIFLWVVLVVEILNKLDDRGAALTEMRARLRSIPAGLNDLFRDILIKSDHGIETSILFFQWMLFRVRSLEPAELFVAIEHSRSPQDSTWEPPTDLQVPPPDRLARIFLDCSRGLVEVIEAGPEQAAVVQFIHETVREFLLKEDGLASIMPALAMNFPGISHEILRIACLRRISTISIPAEYRKYCENAHGNNASLDTFRSSMRLKLPFLDYAISHLFDHAEEAQNHGISQQTFLHSQIDAKGRWREEYRQWWNVLERYKSKKFGSDSTVLHFVLKRGYFHLSPVLLTSLNHFNETPGDQASVLRLASAVGDLQVVQQLLKAGANVNTQEKNIGNALKAASEGGHEKIVQILIDHGAYVNAHGEKSGSALQAASVYGHEKTVQILIDHGADVNAQGGRYGNALEAAATSGYEKVVQLLIDHGADVNARGRYGNALQAARCCGSKKMVQMLRAAGARDRI